MDFQPQSFYKETIFSWVLFGPNS